MTYFRTLALSTLTLCSLLAQIGHATLMHGDKQSNDLSKLNKTVKREHLSMTNTTSPSNHKTMPFTHRLKFSRLKFTLKELRTGPKPSNVVLRNQKKIKKLRIDNPTTKELN